MTGDPFPDSAEDHPAELRALAERLHGLAEELADLALAQLHEAVGAERADSARQRSTGSRRGAAEALERRITRARRAVERAAAILEPPSDD